MEQYKCQFEDEEKKNENGNVVQERESKYIICDMSRSAIMWKMRKFFVCT